MADESDLASAHGGADPAAADGSLLPPQQSIGYLIRDSHRAFRLLLQQRISPHGVTVGMWSYLWALWQQDGLSQRDLAQRINLESPTVGTTLRAMERRGLVVRERNPADRREWRIFLTARGKRLRSQLLDEAARLNEEALSSMSPREVGELYDRLMQLRRTLHSLLGPAAKSKLQAAE